MGHWSAANKHVAYSYVCLYLKIALIQSETLGIAPRCGVPAETLSYANGLRACGKMLFLILSLNSTRSHAISAVMQQCAASFLESMFSHIVFISFLLFAVVVFVNIT